MNEEKPEHEMEFRIDCHKSFAEIFDTMTRNSSQSVIGHLWGILFVGVYMFEGVTEQDVFVPVSKRVEYNGPGDYLYVATGETMMERAALCFDNDETIIRRINENVPRGYDIDMYDDPGMIIYTECREVYDWLKDYHVDFYPNRQAQQVQSKEPNLSWWPKLVRKMRQGSCIFCYS